VEPPENPIPEAPALVDAEIVRHPTSGHDCLLAATEDGRRVAFAFETESAAPGLVLVDPRLWLDAAETGDPEHGEAAFAAVDEAWADDWLQAVVVDPVGSEWLARIKRAHPDAYHEWFAQTQYEEGGEQG
jgi:hypothetical protein